MAKRELDTLPPPHTQTCTGLTATKRVIGRGRSVLQSRSRLEPPGAAIFWVAPEPVLEPIFWSVEAESRSRLNKSAPTPSFSLVYVL